MNFVLTGTMSIPRKHIVEAIERSGHTVQRSLNGCTHRLVVGELPHGAPTGKLRMARRYGTRTISEDELYGILED